VARVAAAVIALAALAAACSSTSGSDGGACTEGGIPAAPTYAVDIKPILVASCVRCHGQGGTLNVDPQSSLAYPPPDGFFDHYEDQGDCVPGDGGITPASCKHGARYFAATMALYITSDVFPMPPPPAPRLSCRDTALISAWAAETPPAP
jgi:hypothetical protein